VVATDNRPAGDEVEPQGSHIDIVDAVADAQRGDLVEPSRANLVTLCQSVDPG
jgi:hypothetical protein